MADNFDILVHHNSDCVHLKLSGDFDGNAAKKLLNVLSTSCRGAFTIFIHTNSLNRIVPGGSSTFRQNLQRLKKDSWRVVFTGENASQLST